MNQSSMARFLLLTLIGMLILMAVQAIIAVGGSITSLLGSPPYTRRDVPVLIAPTNSPPAAQTSVRILALQPDGKLLIGGNFLTVNGIRRRGIARLNADGTLDRTFDPGIGANGVVHAIVVQPDGKILIGGDFSQINNNRRRGIARLNLDGSLDTGFDSGSGVEGSVWELVLQPDGSVIIAGDFRSVAGSFRNYIARLHADGDLDPTFNASAGPQDWITGLDLQPDGNVVIGGNFLNVGGVQRYHVARLLADGTLDSSLNPGSGANERVRELIIQPDGKVLVSGRFTLFNGAPRNRIVRLNADGTVDASFDPGSGANGPVLGLRVQSDGKLLIGGDFTTFNGMPCDHYARLLPSGSLDAAWIGNANGTVWDLTTQRDGKIVIGGDFTIVNGTERRSIARLNVDGTLDLSFSPLLVLSSPLE